MAPALPCLPTIGAQPRERAPDPGFGELLALRRDDINIGCRVHHKQYVQTRVEADRQVATILAELIIGGSRVSRRSA
jgi:hypothetical protein